MLKRTKFYQKSKKYSINVEKSVLGQYTPCGVSRRSKVLGLDKSYTTTT